MIQMVTPHDIKLVLRRKLRLFLGKSTETAATRAALFDSNTHRIVRRLRLRPRPTGGAYSAPLDPLVVSRRPASKGRGGEGREGEGKQGEMKGRGDELKGEEGRCNVVE